MSTRTPGATATYPAAGAGIQGWNDLPRRQMAAAAQAYCAIFRGFEAIRRMQQKTAHQALAHHQVLLEKLKEPCRPMDLMAIQAEMVRFDVQGAALYWQQLAGTLVAMQRELVVSATPTADSGAAGLQKTAAPGLSPFRFDVKGSARTARSPDPLAREAA